MDLRNWEYFIGTGTPVSGASVEVREANLVGNNVSTILASTTTSAEGMWEVTGLSDTPKDVKVTHSGMTWWHKGLTKHSVSQIYFAAPDTNYMNLLRNGAFAYDRLNTGHAVSSAPQFVFETWLAVTGAGSLATLSLDTVVKPSDAEKALKVVHNRVAGSFQIYESLRPHSYRGKNITVSFQVRQGTANSTRVFVYDGITTHASSYSTTVGSFITMTVTAPINAAASELRIGLLVDITDTVYASNGIAVLGSTATSYRKALYEPGEGGSWFLHDAAITTRLIADNAVTTAKIPDGAISDSKMAVQKVNRAGDTITGASRITSGVGVNTGYWYFGTGNNYIGFDGSNMLIAGTSRLVVPQDIQSYRPALPTTGFLFLGNDTNKYLAFVNSRFEFIGANVFVGGDITLSRASSPTIGYIFLGNNGRALGYDGSTPGFYDGTVHRPLWHTGNMGPGTGLNADMVDGQHAVAFQPAGNYALDSHNHTGIYSDAAHNHSGVYQPAGSYAVALSAGIATQVGVLSISTSYQTVVSASLGAGNWEVEVDGVYEETAGSILDGKLTVGGVTVGAGIAVGTTVGGVYYFPFHIIRHITGPATAVLEVKASPAGGTVIRSQIAYKRIS